MAATFAFNKSGLGHFAARLLLLPFSIALMSILYSHSTPVQSRIFLQTGGLVFNVVTLFYVAGIACTALLCKCMWTNLFYLFAQLDISVLHNIC